MGGCLITILGCTQTIEEEVKYGEIAGIVYDKSVGEPIAVAQVQLSPGGNSTVTGTDGSFSFTNIETGEYTITVTKKGYTEGRNTVTVVAGRKSDCNLLMERIPAYVTADKEELDFGDNVSSNTLSFNIVNSSYENLSWHIEYDKSSTSFIDEISPESGTTQYGKTAVIVVKIDREKLNAGPNETTIVVVSDNGDGSSEVKIKAIGQEKSKPRSNVLEITDITFSTVIVKGEISFPGVPSYTERGFVYSTSQNPETGTAIEKLTVEVNENAEFSCLIKGLSYGVKYYVRAYAVNALGIEYSSNQKSFTTIATPPTVTMLNIDHLDASAKTAAFHGTVDMVGDPAYSERGFVYFEGHKTPTLNDSFIKVDGSGIGSYNASVSGLNLGSTYSVRAYAKNEGGVSYSNNTVEFTLTGTAPVVSVGEATDINLSACSAILHGSLDSVGSPAATEKGFVYSYSNQSPTVDDIIVKVAGSDAGSYYATVSQLSLNKTYYVRAYAKNESGVVYSTKVTTFSTNPTASTVSMRAVTNVSLESKSALFQGTIDSAGDPPYYEKGFVYSYTNNEPTQNDNVAIVSGTGIGPFETAVNGLILGKRYYVRAYVTNEAGTKYSSSVIDFSTVPTLASVSMRGITNVNRETLTAVLQGSVDTTGDPPFIEKGFVYSSSNNMPTLTDAFVKVSGNTVGYYETTITGLELGKTYYVRAYVSNEAGIAYSTEALSFSVNRTTPVVSVGETTDISLSGKTAVLHGVVEEVGYPSIIEKGFVYSTNNNVPTSSDNVITVDGATGGAYYAAIQNLSLSMTYYVRAYVRNSEGVYYSSTTTSFSTQPTLPEVSVRPVSQVDRVNLTALLQGCIDSEGNPPYHDRGFVYSSTNNTPSLNDNSLSVKGSGKGVFEATVTGLELWKKYYVRAYAVNAAGTIYSSTVVSFTVSGTTPVITMDSVTDINLTTLQATFTGRVSEIGYPPITERGFVYRVYDGYNPDINDNKVVSNAAIEAGSYHVQIGGLQLDKTYIVRAYAINSEGVIYSSGYTTFNTNSKLPVLSGILVSQYDTEALTADVSATISDSGNPPFTEKGFVYSYTTQNPEVNNDMTVVVDGNQTGKFSTTLSNLVLNKTYYVRAYARNAKGVAYSGSYCFAMVQILPTVSTGDATDVDVDNQMATIHGSITKIGTPAYTERGFVIGSVVNPTIEDQKVVIAGTGTGAFEYRVTGFSKTEFTYYRTYAINKKGVAYGETKYLFDPSYYVMDNYIVFWDRGFAVQKNDVGTGTRLYYYEATNLCNNSYVGSFNNWRLPTNSELVVLYWLKDRIGGFSGYYWCSDHDGAMDFTDGSYVSINAANARCVRSLE